MDRLLVGHVPAGSVSRSFFTVRNSSSAVTLGFHVNCACSRLASCLGVEPSSGELPPNTEMMVKVIFTAGQEPAVFDTDLRVDFYPQQNEMNSGCSVLLAI